MPTTFAPTWGARSAYSIGDRVTFNGAVYRALAAVTAPGNDAADNPIPFDNESWTCEHVVRVQDYYSCIEAVRKQLGISSSDSVNYSIPYFMQACQFSFERTIRVPQMQRRILLRADAQGRLTFPSLILEPLNLRYNRDDNSSPGNITIPYVGDDVASWVRTQNNANVEYYNSSSRSGEVKYRIQGAHALVSPTPDEGTVFELVYYQSEPQLGTFLNSTNEFGEVVNAAGQTVDEWVAAGGSNTRANFQPQRTAVTTNWFTNAAPDLLLAGTMMQAYLYIDDSDAGQYWLNAFNQAKAEIIELTDEFETSAPEDIYQQSIYIT